MDLFIKYLHKFFEWGITHLLSKDNMYVRGFSLIMTIIVAFIVHSIEVPNPSVILFTVMVFFTFLGGFISGSISGLVVIMYSIYFFSLPHQLFSFPSDNFKRVIVIVIFVPIMISLVGTIKTQYLLVNERLQLLLRIDDLTGICNRRYFDEMFAKEYKRAVRMQIPTSILMIDLDSFKQYNDFYGHIAGDNCLRIVAQTINKEVQRAGDIVARYGGEEFVVLLTNTNLNGAKVVGERLLKAVASLDMYHHTSWVDSNVTISIGVATMTFSEGCDRLELINRADKALYKAKKHGRNRIELFYRPS